MRTMKRAKAAEELPVSIDDETHGAKADEGLPADRPVEYREGRDEEHKYHDMDCLAAPTANAPAIFTL